MEWGVHLPHLGRTASRDNLLKFATSTEGWGYDAGWTSDHVAWPAEINSTYPYSDDGSFPGHGLPWLDPLGTLYFVAACTERLRLGVTVLILGYRPAVLTAKMLATLDVLSNGRVIAGVGVGWMKEEFDALQMPYDNRGKRGDEYLEAFDALFTQPEPSYDGKYTKFPKIGFDPKPVQSPVPVWVGGSSDAAFRRTARYGHGFHSAFESVEVMVASWARVQQFTREAGRDPKEITLSIRWYLDPDAKMNPKKSLYGSAQHMRDQVAELADIGISHVVLDPVAGGGPEGRLAALQRFADEVMHA